MTDVRVVPIDDIRLSGENMRIDAPEVDELAESIREQGLLQPLVVTPDLVLVCGHRRLAEIMKRLELLRKTLNALASVSEDGKEIVVKKRTCKHPGCITILSRFTRVDYCGAHEREHPSHATA